MNIASVSGKLKNKNTNKKTPQKTGSGSQAGRKFKSGPCEREVVLAALPSLGQGAMGGLPREPRTLGTSAFHLAAGPVASLGPRPILRESSLQLRVPNCHLPMPKGKIYSPLNGSKEHLGTTRTSGRSLQLPSHTRSALSSDTAVSKVPLPNSLYR